MLNDGRALRQAFVVGFIGYSSVAVFYSVFDLLASRGTLYTVNLLGRALFRGLRNPAVLMFPVEPDYGAIFAYNALHFALAILIGLIVTGLVGIAERNPRRRHVVRLLIVAGFFVTVMIVGSLTTQIRPLLPMWSIVAANAIPAILAGAYLLKQRPGLWQRLALTPRGLDQSGSSVDSL